MNTRIRKGVSAIALSVTLGLWWPGLPVWAGFKPPGQKLSRPGNRQAAATRGRCGTDEERPLTTLVPLGNVGLTTAAYPTFHWYMPEDNTYPVAQFVLYKVTNISPVEEVEIYRTQFQISQEAGLASLQLPADATMPALAVDQEYHWQVQLICPNSEEDASGDQFADGWIKRVHPTASFVDQLEQASPFQKYEILASEGFWYDALAQLTALQESSPQDERLVQEWRALLDSEAVRLHHIPAQISARP